MKFLQIKIYNAGGEYTCGIIHEEEKVNAMLEAIDNEEVSGSMAYGENNSLEHFEYDEIVHQYGPSIVGAKILIDSHIDEEFDKECEEIFNEAIDSTKVNIFMEEEPNVSNEIKEKYPTNSLIWSHESVEKRMVFPINLILENSEELDLSNLFIGYINMDETINYAEITSSAYYVNKENQILIAKEFYENEYEYDNNELVDFINELFFEENKEHKARVLLDTFKLEVGDIYGKGENENDYNKITNFDYEVLYEEGEY